MAGYHDPVSVAARDRLEELAATLMDADDRLASGHISALPARDGLVAGVRPDVAELGARHAPVRQGRVVAQLFQVLSLMAVPTVILLTIRYLIVRQNRLAGGRSNAAPDRMRR